jgi:ceramide glucosyltransferase
VGRTSDFGFAWRLRRTLGYHCADDAHKQRAVILNLIFGFLALLSLALTLWQWLVARRFPLHQRVPAPSSAHEPRNSLEKVASSPQPSPPEAEREEPTLWRFWGAERVRGTGSSLPDRCSRRGEGALTVASRPSSIDLQPPVTLLKPLKGCDAATEDCLRSWFAQQYSGPVQILFGVAAADDPVCGIVRKLLQEFTASDAQLVVGSPLPGANAKVAKLAELEGLAKHELLVISDADVRVPRDFLANIVAPLCSVSLSLGEGLGERTSRPFDALCGPEPKGQDGPLTPALSPSEGERGNRRQVSGEPRFMGRACGLVCCFYRLANPTTLAMQWEAIAVNADFWSQVLQARSLKPLDFALGAVMATRRRQLREIGGFAGLVDCLADDYQLGNRIARRGYAIALSPVVVECWSAPMGWADVWKHQLRWARTIRVCQPVPYFFSILSNATLWPVVWLMVKPDVTVAVCALVCLLVRILTALNLQHRLNQDPAPGAQVSPRAPSDRAPQLPSSAPGRYAWLIPLKNLLQAAIWLLAFLGNRIEWRGQRLRLRRDGTLERLNRPAA